MGVYPSDDGAYRPPLPRDPNEPDESMFRAWMTRLRLSGLPATPEVSGWLEKSFWR